MRELNIENKITISETDFKNAISIARFFSRCIAKYRYK